MKKTTLFCLIFMQSIMCAFSQDGDEADGFEYVKRVDKNHPDNKNVLVDYYYLPLHDGDENTKEFKIVRDSTENTCILEYINHAKTEKETIRCSFTISNQFAEKMHKKMASLFINFKEAKFENGIIVIELDGYSVTFRTVVEDDVWYLKIRNPSGNADKLHNLCYQILEDAFRYKDDAEGKKLDEESYIKILDDFNFERTKTKD